MKKVISVLLALVLAFGACVPAFAHSAQQAGECSDLPVVIVRGMDFNGLSIDYGTEQQRPAIAPIDAKGVVGCLVKMIYKGVMNFSFDPAMDVLLDYVNEIMGGLSMNPDGSSMYNVGYKKYPLSADHYEEVITDNRNEPGIARACTETFAEGHTYYFYYDWRIDPWEVADDINETVNTALRETGHDKVKIVCSSMGGIMTVAYLTKYGYSKVERCLFMSSTFCGAQVASDMLTGKVKITPDNLYKYVLSLVGDKPAAGVFIKVLNKLGAFKAVTKLTDFIIDNYKEEAYEKTLTPIFGYMLPLWGLVQPQDFGDALDFIFGDKQKENAEFIAKAERLQLMMKNRDKLINEMIHNGVKIAVVAHYDTPLAPVYESANFNGDGVLETYQMSGYATVAKYGETLGDDYVPADPKYLSPDRTVDLSTALYPEYTYIIKGAPHVSCSYGSDMSGFLMWLLSCDGEFYAGVNEKYPQFMVSDKNQSLRAFD